MTDTTHRVESATSPRSNQRIAARTMRHVADCAHGQRADIDRRMDSLDREWDVERVIELEAALTIGGGLLLGLTRRRSWLALSAFAAAMVLRHTARGGYPLLPLLRRLGVRSAAEISHEHRALRVLRGDHSHWTQDSPGGRRNG
jgi:hypothetical protein